LASWLAGKVSKVQRLCSEIPFIGHWRKRKTWRLGSWRSTEKKEYEEVGEEKEGLIDDVVVSSATKTVACALAFQHAWPINCGQHLLLRF